LIQAVLVLEQLLSSGGGWQDQAHGIVPGLKTVTSAPEIPLRIKIDPIALSEEDSSDLEKRLLFAYTGKTRLAKNILRKVLQRWARRTNEIVDVVEGLVSCSSAVRTALSTRSWDSLGEHLHQAHNLKCAMAGEGSCAEPESVKLFLSEMMDHGQIKGAMLCGAGGGGFLLLLLSQDADRNSVVSLFETSIRSQSKDFEDFSFHDCKIAKSGLTTSVLHDESSSMNSDTYKLLWQQQTIS
jgi:fucokinase